AGRANKVGFASSRTFHAQTPTGGPGGTAHQTARAPTLSERAYYALRRDILNGALKPDLPLRFEVLKERYGLSFSPLREALARLEAERLVKATALRGYRVAAVSIDEMWDAINTRILIETAALRESLAHGSSAWEVDGLRAYHALEHCARSRRAGSKIHYQTAPEPGSLHPAPQAFLGADQQASNGDADASGVAATTRGVGPKERVLAH